MQTVLLEAPSALSQNRSFPYLRFDFSIGYRVRNPVIH